MQIYLFPIRVTMLAFPFIAALIVLPVYIYQYRKFGFVNCIIAKEATIDSLVKLVEDMKRSE